LKLHEELKCLGLLGFGSGYAWGHANIRPDEKLDGRDGYCAKECPEQSRCLNVHRNKVRLMFPKATKAFDEMLLKLPQGAATHLWRKQNPSVPFEPYALQMIANAEDGLAVAQTGKPKDRGRLTLQWNKKQTA
jgi:hypothetical protein